MRLRDIRSLMTVEKPARTVSGRLERHGHNIEDMRKMAASRLPRGIFDYLDGGSDDEVSLRRNRTSFDEWSFVPQWGSGQKPDLSSTLLGGHVSMPLTLSPTGGSRLFHPGGEIAAARAALDAGIPYGLAHLSTTAMEKVSAQTPGLRKWFNIEPVRDRDLLQASLDRARNAGYEGLLVNVDCRTIGNRERDHRNGFTVPPALRLKTLVEGALHPGWTLGFLLNEAIHFPNLDGSVPEGTASSSPDMWKSMLEGVYEPTTWEDIGELRARWSGPIILKGCVSANDAVRAADLGIDGIQVGNHGGRQLDHMASALDVLPDIVERTEGRIQIIVDGGIRRGSDIVKALALGAHACSIGRPYLYGLAAAGQAGVAHVLQILRQEMTRTMMLLGVSSIEELRALGPHLLRHRGESKPARAPRRVSEKSINDAGAMKDATKNTYARNPR